MGGKQSKNKRFRTSENLRHVRRNNDLHTHNDPEDPMNDPTYHLQGEPDTYTNEVLDQDDIWVPRGDSDATCKTFNDDDYQFDPGQLVYRETVLQGPEKESWPSDHYDMINESELDEPETELKQLATSRTNNTQQRLYHRLPLQSPLTNRLNRRPDYEHMVKIFQPLLIANVIVRRLLPHLPFVSNPDRIRAIEERDPRAAVIYLIDELCSSSGTEPGRWKQFIQALEICGYKYIVDTLRGQEPVDHTYQREYLKIITPILRELINPSELLPVLWAVDVISNEDREEIVQLERNWGPLAAADKLLDLVPRRHKHWYSHLVDALKNVGRTEAADILAIPEIQSLPGENETVACKKQSSTDNKSKESSAPHVMKNLTDFDYINEEEPSDIETESDVEIVPNNCEYLECDDYCGTETDELNDLYLSMRNSDKPRSGIERFESASRSMPDEIETKDLHEEDELYEEPDFSSWSGNTSLKVLHANSQYKQSDTLDEKLSNRCEQDLEDTAREPETEGMNDMDSIASVTEREASDRSDVYKYEPPLPASIAPETPVQKDGTAEDSSQNETDTDDCMTDDLTETVEVIPLPVPTRKTCRHDEYKGKRMYKPPRPTPRKQTEEVLPVPPRKKHSYYEYTCCPPDKAICKPPKPAPRKRTVPNKSTLLHKEDLDDSNRRATVPSEAVKGQEISKNTDDTEKTHQMKPPDEFNRNLSDIFESLEEDTHPLLRTDKKRFCHTKVKASVLKRKNKWKKFQHSKLNSRRKPLNIIHSRLPDAKCVKFERGKALMNRDRMATPKIDRKRNVHPENGSKSESLPLEFRQSDPVQNNTSDCKQVSGAVSNKNVTNTQPQYYSEPFRSHRSKEDEDIFTTVGHILPDCKSRNNAQLADRKDAFKFQKTHLHSSRRRMSDTDELLDILRSCNLECNEDYILKSATEIKTVTKDSLNPKLRGELEKVRDLEMKLHNLIHGGKVLSKRLQLQEDVNEVLKQHRHLSSKLSVKEKEAKALEAAIAGETSVLVEDDFVPYSTDELCSRVDLLNDEQQALFGNKTILKDKDFLVDAPRATGNSLTGVEVVKGKFENVDKDSAFYSEYTTKL